MSDDFQDDQSHYEISLTGGQALVAFVLLLLSLGASFAFGLMVGKGQADSRLVVQREPAVVTEASAVGKPAAGRIVELGVPESTPAETETAPATESASTESAPAPTVVEEPMPADGSTPAVQTPPLTTPEPQVVDSRPSDPRPLPAVEKSVPHYAQLLSTGDQKTAEALAARLIDNGFTSAYVERGASEKGQIFRVRVRFSSESDARAAEARLRTFSKDVWITK